MGIMIYTSTFSLCVLKIKDKGCRGLQFAKFFIVYYVYSHSKLVLLKLPARLRCQADDTFRGSSVYAIQGEASLLDKMDNQLLESQDSCSAKKFEENLPTSSSHPWKSHGAIFVHSYHLFTANPEIKYCWSMQLHRWSDLYSFTKIT